MNGIQIGNPLELKQANPPMLKRGSAMQSAMEFLGDKWLRCPQLRLRAIGCVERNRPSDKEKPE